MGKRMLIVDDEGQICRLLAHRLMKEGYSCITAHSGNEALNHFYEEKISSS